jgi:hypothetical protein
MGVPIAYEPCGHDPAKTCALLVWVTRTRRQGCGFSQVRVWVGAKLPVSNTIGEGFVLVETAGIGGDGRVGRV